MTVNKITDDIESECIVYAKKMKIEYDEEGKRYAICSYCNEKIRNSIVPHMKKKHKNEWKLWQLSFLNLYNKGLSPQKIMLRFSSEKMLLSWTVIEREIKRISEESKIDLEIRRRSNKVITWEPNDFKKEKNTVWSFPSRGNWAVHTNEYRGNWSPYIPRNLILKYSKKNETVLDPFIGSGTTLIEAYLLGRNGIGFDISPHAVSITNKLLEMMKIEAQKTLYELPNVNINCSLRDARNLDIVEDDSIDLICTHPPYAFSIKYTETKEEDLSRLKVRDYYKQMEIVAKEFFRVLKFDRFCAILIGDIRKNKILYPLGFKILEIFTDAGFKIQDIIIKRQHKERGTMFYRNNNKIEHIISHEYLMIFKKKVKIIKE